MIKKRIAKFYVLTAGILAFPALSFAGTETAADAKTPIEKIKESRISGDLGVNFVSQYVFRGYVLENQGVIAQPFADLAFKLYEGDGFINSVSVTLGVWASIHSEHTDAGPGSTTPAWYEFDYYPGVSVGFAKNFTLSASYLEFLSPNDGFRTARLVQAKLAYSDSDLFGGKFALNPYLLTEYYFEAPDNAWYFEVGVTPALPSLGPVAVTLPLKAGFGAKDFYVSTRGDGTTENESFGYVSAGVNLAYQLPINDSYGTWTVNAGATYYYLGDALESFNDPNVRESNEHEFVFQGGLMVAF